MFSIDEYIAAYNSRFNYLLAWVPVDDSSTFSQSSEQLNHAVEGLKFRRRINKITLADTSLEDEKIVEAFEKWQIMIYSMEIVTHCFNRRPLILDGENTLQPAIDALSSTEYELISRGRTLAFHAFTAKFSEMGISPSMVAEDAGRVRDIFVNFNPLNPYDLVNELSAFEMHTSE